MEPLKSFIIRFNPMSLLKSASLKNVMVLMSGTMLSQILPILFFPILSRLYSPADYGVLGLFMSISMLLMVLSNFQLNYAILIPKDDKEALRVFCCGNYLVIFISLLSFAAVFLFGSQFSQLMGSPDLRNWLYLLPVTIFLTGINIQFSAWFHRLGRFKIITSSRILTSIITIAVSLGLSFLMKGAGGLIMAYLLGNLAAFIVMTVVFLQKQSFQTISLKEGLLILKEHRNFPIYTMPTELISNFAQQLPLYIFSMYSGVQSVGLFTRSRQILALPINYISVSVSEVYKQKASEAFRNNAPALRPLFIKTISYLFFLSIIPFLIIAILSPSLFAFFFGENWRQAGVFSQCLALMYFFKFVISPLTFNFYLFGKQRLDFILHLLIILITSIGLFAGFYFYNSDVYALILFSASYSLMYLIYGFLSYRFTFISTSHDKNIV
jgi:O-antigen/teichoic acid export membrane protein